MTSTSGCIALISGESISPKFYQVIENLGSSTYGASPLFRSTVLTSYPVLIKIASADVYVIYCLVV
ncbi:hypothetical protein C2845_PM09G11530 [Panicum miliaceum]|uniref:Uncharacterized protein n=1 Tax=Panicum miliaceum TaxID=4540 RepID=A0A3L6S156_PANMI|nr:hypothetical protein C2845_PM09G11530 [Panicum miliaceum]